MVLRYYGLNYAEDASKAISNGVATTSKDIEIVFDLGANSSSAEYVFLKQNRALALAQVRRLCDELESGKLPWPPALS